MTIDTTTNLLPETKDSPGNEPSAGAAPADAGGAHQADLETAPTSPITAALDLTHLGNAKRFKRHFGDVAAFRDDTSTWHLWDGKRWREDKNGLRIMKKMTSLVEELHAEADAEPNRHREGELLKWARNSQSRSAVEGSVALAQSELLVSGDQFDVDPWILNVANGTIDLRTGELQPHRAADYLTRLADVVYDPQAQSADWDKFIERALPDREIREFAQRCAGYTLSGALDEDVFLIVRGPSRTGKSTFLSALGAALGEYANVVAMESLAERDRSGRGVASPELVALRSARMASIQEAGSRLRLDTGLMKALSAGEKVTARALYQGEVTFKPQFTIWVATNHRLELPDDDAALWERVREIPFMVVIPEDERRRDLRECLSDPVESGPAVLAWAVRGCLAWQEKGLGAPPQIKEATRAYRESMDPFAAFFMECCSFGPHEEVSSAGLRQAYEAFCREEGERPLSMKALAIRLQDHGCSPHRGKARSWRGIGLKGNPLHAMATPGRSASLSVATPATATGDAGDACDASSQ